MPRKKSEKLNSNLSVLKKTFKKNKTEKSKLALSLLDKAFFMEKTLEELKSKIESDGVVTVMPQGSYSIERENPALKSYNTTIKNYTAIIKQLNEMLPKNDSTDDDGFDEFGE